MGARPKGPERHQQNMNQTWLQGNNCHYVLSAGSCHHSPWLSQGYVPVPEEIARPAKSFKNTQFLDCAISNIDEVRSFYYIKQDSISKLGKHWASAIGSFSKDHILSHKTKRFQVSNEDIEANKVESLSFKTFQKKFDIEAIDFLHIDAEGAEFDIMYNIDYESIDIKKIFFEKKHFDGPFSTGEKLNIIKKILIKNNYFLSDIDNENILAEKK